METNNITAVLKKDGEPCGSRQFYTVEGCIIIDDENTDLMLLMTTECYHIHSQDERQVIHSEAMEVETVAA